MISMGVWEVMDVVILARAAKNDVFEVGIAPKDHRENGGESF